MSFVCTYVLKNSIHERFLKPQVDSETSVSNQTSIFSSIPPPSTWFPFLLNLFSVRYFPHVWHVTTLSGDAKPSSPFSLLHVPFRGLLGNLHKSSPYSVKSPNYCLSWGLLEQTNLSPSIQAFTFLVFHARWLTQHSQKSSYVHVLHSHISDSTELATE